MDQGTRGRGQAGIMSKKQGHMADHADASILGENEPNSGPAISFSVRDAVLYPTDEVEIKTTYATRKLVVKKVIRRTCDVPDWTTLCFRGQRERAYILRGQEETYMLTVPVSTADQSPPKLTSPERSPENEIVIDIEISREDTSPEM